MDSLSPWVYGTHAIALCMHGVLRTSIMVTAPYVVCFTIIIIIIIIIIASDCKREKRHLLPCPLFAHSFNCKFAHAYAVSTRLNKAGHGIGTCIGTYTIKLYCFLDVLTKAVLSAAMGYCCITMAPSSRAASSSSVQLTSPVCFHHSSEYQPYSSQAY